MREGRGLGEISIGVTGDSGLDFGEKSVENRNEIWVDWKGGHGCTQEEHDVSVDSFELRERRAFLAEEAEEGQPLHSPRSTLKRMKSRSHGFQCPTWTIGTRHMQTPSSPQR